MTKMKSILRLLPILLVSIVIFSSCQNEVAQIINAATHAVPVANAGPSKTIQLPINKDTLRGTGSSANGPITGYLWSLVSGPNNPIIVSPSSRITPINDMIAGNYIFQFAVIDSAGYTGIDTVSIKVIPSNAPVQQTLVLQPANNPSEVLIEGGATIIGNDPQPPELPAGAWTNGGVLIIFRSALKFNLSSIPSNSTIISAKLSLYTHPAPLNGDHVNSNSGSNNSMFIRRITSNWTPTSFTWPTQPSVTTSNQVSIPHTNVGFLDVTNIDVKNLVSDMHALGNNGFMLGLQNEVIYNIRVFGSSYYSDSTKHPKLVVVYQ
jgi:hypothetical protein